MNHCEGPDGATNPGEDPKLRSIGDRFAILDSRPGDSPERVWQQWWSINGKNGALYYPWIKVRGFQGGYLLVPPCGHVAGVYARTDRWPGMHKAPANEILEGVVDLERQLTDADQADLNPKRINCLRSFPGRGIRVWGARTLSNHCAMAFSPFWRLGAVLSSRGTT
ncbi:MAG: phage tail sheath subtilisin-like domain-containing protein [Terriglobia bacterium]